ncbi:hypothetical protein [Marinifilum fragile]|uniref:hypothetical protein n=1 Tax=Marinifilum fragile TaxID=570161 RepID=UPI002AA85546|nr:hypothetical protein [Marinifilum fragile]
MRITSQLIILLILNSFFSCQHKASQEKEAEPMPKLIDFQLDKYKSIIDEKVSQYQNQSRVKENPLIVLDGKPYRYNNLKKEKTLKVYADTIVSIGSLPWKTGKALYGNRAEDGVIIILTKR